MRPFILRRTKEDVLDDLPKKTEMILYTGLSAMQKKYYKWILTKNESVLSQNKNVLMNGKKIKLTGDFDTNFLF